MERELRILILEDVATDAELMELELGRANVSFLSKRVETREDFIRELHDFTPDLILSAYYLPAFVGSEALAIVMEESPEVPFILVTGALDEGHAVEILKRGATDYILKDGLSRLPHAVVRSLREAEEKRERKRAEKALLNAARQWRATFDGINNGVCLLDQDARILRCNIAMQQLLGKPFSEIIGHKIWTLLKCIQEAEKKCPAKHMRKTQQRKTSECFLNNRWFNITADPIIDRDSELSGAVYIITDITDRKQAEEKIRVYQEQLQSLVTELSFAEERERRRIAMDIHDYIGQTLAITKIKLGILQELASSHDVAGPLDEIRGLIEQAIQYTRSLTSELSLPILYELGLESALRWLSEQTQKRHGILVECEDDGLPKPMNDEIRGLLFKSVRELLFNVVKHAQASKAKVSISKDGDDIRITVQDNGIGFESSPINSFSDITNGFGLFSIRERLSHLGGHLEIESSRGRGTRVTIVAPLSREKSNAGKHYEYKNSHC